MGGASAARPGHRAHGRGVRVAGRAAWLLLGAAAAALVVVFGASWGAGLHLSRPARHPVGPPPAALAAEPVSLPVPSSVPSLVPSSPALVPGPAAGPQQTPGPRVAGWFASGRPGQGAVLLLHALRSDRRQMLGRALALHADGFAVLLIDLPAHGESDGTRITFGNEEALGVRAAMDYLRARLPGERIGVIGVSLGAAACVLDARAVPAQVHALVLEAMYPSIEEAVHNRLAMRVGATAAQGLAPLLLWQLPLRLDIGPDQLRPIAHMAALERPVLIASGAQDLHTTAAQTRALFDAARAPKQLWLVEGAAHVDLYDFDVAAYEAQVFPFLRRYLRPSAVD